jgi:glucuronoxylan 4-O-methyltransferase
VSLPKRIIRRFLSSPLGRPLYRWGAAPSRWLAIRHPTVLTLMAMGHLNHFLTSGRQVNAIVQALRRRKFCNLLIFGFGHDSPFYQAINAGGRTVFLEDHEGWFRDVTTKYPHLEAYRVHYKTRVSEWQKYLDQPGAYATDLPEAVTNLKWDLIFVDAPAGFAENTPGRMESIRLASVLIKRPGDVFVHDCQREVENKFSTHFLKAENLKEEIGNLRYYVFAAE